MPAKTQHNEENFKQIIEKISHMTGLVKDSLPKIITRDTVDKFLQKGIQTIKQKYGTLLHMDDDLDRYVTLHEAFANLDIFFADWLSKPDKELINNLNLLENHIDVCNKSYEFFKTQLEFEKFIKIMKAHSFAINDDVEEILKFYIEEIQKRHAENIPIEILFFYHKKSELILLFNQQIHNKLKTVTRNTYTDAKSFLSKEELELLDRSNNPETALSFTEANLRSLIKINNKLNERLVNFVTEKTSKSLNEVSSLKKLYRMCKELDERAVNSFVKDEQAETTLTIDSFESLLMKERVLKKNLNAAKVKDSHLEYNEKAIEPTLLCYVDFEEKYNNFSPETITQELDNFLLEIHNSIDNALIPYSNFLNDDKTSPLFDSLTKRLRELRSNVSLPVNPDPMVAYKYQNLAANIQAAAHRYQDFEQFTRDLHTYITSSHFQTTFETLKEEVNQRTIKYRKLFMEDVPKALKNVDRDAYQNFTKSFNYIELRSQSLFFDFEKVNDDQPLDSKEVSKSLSAQIEEFHKYRTDSFRLGFEIKKLEALLAEANAKEKTKVAKEVKEVKAKSKEGKAETEEANEWDDCDKEVAHKKSHATESHSFFKKNDEKSTSYTTTNPNMTNNGRKR